MIIKRRYTANFTTISNNLFDDDRLGADEVGILAYLRSRPHDWEVRRPALARRWNMGRDAIKRVISNLVRTGWCVARKDRLANGTFFMIYEIRDEPGPTLTDEEVRRALSLVSSEAASDESDVIVSPASVPDTAEPPTPYPSLADPPPAEAALAYIDIPNKDLPRTESTQKIERERAREKEKHALNLAQFKRRWPTNASDDQAKVDGAWYGLSLDEGEAALAGIAPFLEEQKRNHRKHPPAGFTYLGQKRWTLIPQPKTDIATPNLPPAFEVTSPEGKAILALYAAGCCPIAEYGGKVRYQLELTSQLMAFADLPEKSLWPFWQGVEQIGAWRRFVALHVIGNRRDIVTERGFGENRRRGIYAPHPFPPLKDGTWSPEGELNDDDLNALASEAATNR